MAEIGTLSIGVDLKGAEKAIEQAEKLEDNIDDVGDASEDTTDRLELLNNRLENTDSALDGVKDKIGRVKDKIPGGGGGLLAGLVGGGAVIGGILLGKKALGKLGDAAEWAKDKIDGIDDTIGDVSGGIKDFASDISSTFNDIVSPVTNFFDNIKDSIGDLVNSDLFKKLIAGIAGIGSAAGAASGKFTSLFKNLPSAKNLIGKGAGIGGTVATGAIAAPSIALSTVVDKFDGFDKLLPDGSGGGTASAGFVPDLSGFDANIPSPNLNLGSNIPDISLGGGGGRTQNITRTSNTSRKNITINNPKLEINKSDTGNNRRRGSITDDLSRSDIRDLSDLLAEEVNKRVD